MHLYATAKAITVVLLDMLASLGTVLILLSNTSAQPVQNDSLSSIPSNVSLTIYEDPIYGFKIDYPSVWKKIEGNNLVEFQVPENAFLKLGNSSLVALEVRIDPLPSNIDSLDKYTRAKLIPYRQLGQFELTEVNRTTIGENIPAIKTVYTNTFPKTGIILKTMEINVVRDNLGYDIRYFANPSVNYPANLPLVQKMIDSFEFVGLTQ
jgi:hypothetical protein